MKWQKWLNRGGVDLTTTEYVDRVLFSMINKSYKKLEENFFTTLENKAFTHYMKVDMARVGKYFYDKYYFKPEQIKKYYFQSLKDLWKNNAAVKKWEKRLVGNRKRKDLVLALKDFTAIFKKFNYQYSISPFLPIEAWEKDFEKILTPLLINKNAAERELILNSLSRPWKKTYLASLKNKFGKWSQEKILKNSQFLRSWSVIWFEPLGSDWVRDLQSAQGRAARKQKPLSAAELIKRLRPNQEQAGFIKIAPYLAFYKDWRDEARRRQVYSWSFLFDKIAVALGVPREQLGYLTLAEIRQSLLLGKIDKDLIKRRSNKLILVTSRPGSLEPTVVDENTGKYLKIIRGLEATEKSDIIQGLVAFPGKVSGRARIIRSAADLVKFKPGEILVANTTHPNYLPAMQKALAIVTNEGGIMSHAAITAREMKKPCIVGTKIATKVLKDGMMVEVDADKGVVKIIK